MSSCAPFSARFFLYRPSRGSHPWLATVVPLGLLPAKRLIARTPPKSAEVWVNPKDDHGLQDGTDGGEIHEIAEICENLWSKSPAGDRSADKPRRVLIGSGPALLKRGSESAFHPRRHSSTMICGGRKWARKGKPVRIVVRNTLSVWSGSNAGGKPSSVFISPTLRRPRGVLSRAAGCGSLEA